MFVPTALNEPFLQPHRAVRKPDLLALVRIRRDGAPGKLFRFLLCFWFRLRTLGLQCPAFQFPAIVYRCRKDAQDSAPIMMRTRASISILFDTREFKCEGVARQF